MNNNFTKQERLHRKKDIGYLFDKGKSTFSYPYKIKWVETENSNSDIPVQLLISVSKKGFKKAVSRNKIKRFIREAYRTQKTILWDSLNKKQIHIAIIYIHKEENDFEFHKKAITKLLTKLSKEIR